MSVIADIVDPIVRNKNAHPVRILWEASGMKLDVIARGVVVVTTRLVSVVVLVDSMVLHAIR